MKRRTFVISVGSIAAASGAALGSGAFDLVQADRSVSIDVQNDQNGLIGLSEGDTNEFVSTDGDNLLQLNYGGSGSATGVNENAVTRVENAFVITNNSTKGVGVKVEDDATADVLSFEASDGTSVDTLPSNDASAPHNLDPTTGTNPSVTVTFEFDSNKDYSDLNNITVTADDSAYTSA